VAEAVASVLVALAVMFTLALIALELTGAASSAPLIASAFAVLCLAVGGSIGFTGGSGGGFISIGMNARAASLSAIRCASVPWSMTSSYPNSSAIRIAACRGYTVKRFTGAAGYGRVRQGR
jgi:hypothetical protein